MSDITVHYWMIPGLAVGLDLLFGDPKHLPHPVRFVGWLAECAESVARTLFPPRSLRLGGALAALALMLGLGLVVEVLEHAGALGFFAAVYLSYAGLALSCLLSEAKYVNRLLDSGQLTEAKVALSQLVTRDTDDMGESEVRSALAETVSENLNDGFVAPLFWLCVGGPAVLWVYKTVSTLDSMWGYKNDKYRDFGWFAAKADDALAYVPARLTALALWVGGQCMRLHTNQAWNHAREDAGKSASPNAGWPMATAAWLLDAQMGGTASYFGEQVEKPVLGPEGAQWNSRKIRRLIRLCRGTGIALAVLGQLVVMLAAI
ncbi:MAG: adenosylcobinamide-phosphate synthase CbiB [Desulfovibrionaceae bacterium]